MMMPPFGNRGMLMGWPRNPKMNMRVEDANNGRLGDNKLVATKPLKLASIAQSSHQSCLVRDLVKIMQGKT
jgi:hypothetical protein